MKKQLVLLMFLTLISLCLPVGESVARNGPIDAQKEAIETVDLCDIIQSPHDYDGKMVRISGTYSNSFEGSTLSKSNCTGRGKRVEATWSCEGDIACAELEEKVRKGMQGNPFDGEWVEVTVIGRVKAQLPKSRINNSNNPIVVFYINEVESTAPTTPECQPAIRNFGV